MSAASYSESPKCEVERIESPFERLNDSFIKQNGELSEMVSELTRTLHKLSDTNVPKTETILDKKQEPGTPFRYGHLMNYYEQLNRMARIVIDLKEQVLKIEALI